MDMLHPVMQQALRPFLHIPRESEVTYTHRSGDTAINCRLEYEPADDGAPEYGQPTHKPTPVSMTLVSACVGGHEVLDLLSTALIAQIEREALEAK